jgi:ABC-2 type transport system permease protein
MNPQPTPQPGKTSVGWRLVAKKELADLWRGGRAMAFLIMFSSLLGITSFLLATNSELKLLPPREMVFMILQISISVSLFISLLIAADAISGERERATLESLLLVPTSRRQLVLGKFVAAMSIWPAAFLIAALHLIILSPNGIILGASLLWGSLLGSLLVVGFTAFGMIVSLLANSNRTSLFVSLFVAVLFLLPTQFPGTAQTGFMGKLVKRINPMESINQFLEKILVNNRTVEEMISWLASPIVLAVVTLVLLFLVAAPRLDLTGDKMRTWRPRRKKAVLSLLLFFALTSPTTPTHAQTASPAAALTITIDVATKELKTGDSLTYTTTVTNHQTKASAPLVVAMNLVNLGDGDPVDPEDWSPLRTQHVAPLSPGGSADLIWTINAILEGDYLAYMVVIPAPDSAQATSLPVASQGIHLTVQQFSPLNPGGVAPVAFGTPLLLSLLLSLQLWQRRRQLDGSQ